MYCFDNCDKTACAKRDGGTARVKCRRREPARAIAPSDSRAAGLALTSLLLDIQHLWCLLALEPHILLSLFVVSVFVMICRSWARH